MDHTKGLEYSELSIYAVLDKDTIKELKEMAVMIHISGYSKLKKQELIDVIAGQILDEDHLRNALILAKKKELDLLQRIVMGTAVYEKDYVISELIYFLSQGFFLLSKESKLVFPVEVKEKIKTVLTKEFCEEQTRFQLVSDYTNAIVRLWGAAQIDEIVTIFNEQNEEYTTKAEVKAVYEANDSRGLYYELKKGMFVHETVRMEENGLDELTVMQGDKPKFVPEKKDITKFADDVYYSQQREYEALKFQLKKYVLKENEIASDICDEIQVACSLSLKLSQIMGILEHYGVMIENTVQAENVVPYIVDLYNNTRMWIHNGHTPKEISDLTGKRSVLLSMPYQKTTVTRINHKVGRNEVCPCGSGKKYKYCCGR